jgi:hypothetical protein
VLNLTNCIPSRISFNVNIKKTCNFAQIPYFTMESTYENCQSCGMPMKRDENGGGTNADGSKSLMYCSKCYADGAFRNPDMTLTEMQDLVKGKLKEFGFPGFIAGFFTKGIPKLERWKNAASKGN